MQAAPPGVVFGETPCGSSAMVATAPCTTADRTARLWLHRRARRASPPSADGSRTWYVTSPGITNPSRSTRLRRNVNRVGELDFLLLEFGDLGP